MPNDPLTPIRETAQRLLDFVPQAELDHYRCPARFPYPAFKNAPEELMPELLRFFATAKQATKGCYTIHFEQVDHPILPLRSYSIMPHKDECLVMAPTLDGLRDAVYELEAQLCGRNFGETICVPAINHRIGRIFCGPINRPPLYHDELADDTDYYPEPYLNELARNGITDVWISSDFKKLTGPDCQKRLEKLDSIVRKCMAYGIGVYIFCIEPIALEPDDPRLAEHPELAGPLWQKKHGFCPSSKYAVKLLEDTTRQIFKAVPKLSGIIDLSVGEWYTLCCNVPHSTGIKCPNCGDTPAWKTLNRSLRAMLKGMRSVNPDAQLISWPYTMTGWWSESEALEAARHPLQGVPLCHNFESGGGAVQLGKYRKVKDYWLSYTGPSDFFYEVARRMHTHEGQLFAKIQACCSTELSTTGYLPVPALLYRKFEKLQRLGVEGVLMGWYFGTYPSLMTRAALKLSHMDFPTSEKGFLVDLAAERWGRERSETVAAIWKQFSDAFALYPLCNQLAYTGPLNDAIAWPLHLIPVNRRLTPSWETSEKQRGDRIFDCLTSFWDRADSFTPNEALTLLSRMADKWTKALIDLKSLDDGTLDMAQKLEISVAKAASILFQDAADIFRFYIARDTLLFGRGNKATLAKMRAIVQAAIQRSKDMLDLMKINPVLGYHSEATDYKFTPEEIQSRIEQLTQCLEKDFPAVEQMLADKIRPMGAFADAPSVEAFTTVALNVCGIRTTTYAGAYPSDHFTPVEPRGDLPCITLMPSDNGWTLTILAPNSPKDDAYALWWEPVAGHPAEYLTFKGDGTITYWPRAASPITGARSNNSDGSYLLVLYLPKVPFGTRDSRFIRFNIQRSYSSYDGEFIQTLVRPNYLKWVYTLGTRDTRDCVQIIV